MAIIGGMMKMAGSAEQIDNVGDSKGSLESILGFSKEVPIYFWFYLLSYVTPNLNCFRDNNFYVFAFVLVACLFCFSCFRFVCFPSALLFYLNTLDIL